MPPTIVFPKNSQKNSWIEIRAICQLTSSRIGSINSVEITVDDCNLASSSPEIFRNFTEK
jgi:hypothetical protein